MYSLRLTCKSEDVDFLAAELYEAGTIGIRELDENGEIVLIAGFETNEHRAEMLARFSANSPTWYAEETVDWVGISHDAWPAREIGKRLFLAPPWVSDPTPRGRVRLIHNPGAACGTGEHPCTRLALVALEKLVLRGRTIVDVGTGSGILAVGALTLGAGRAIGIDIDCAALMAARENFDLNGVRADLICGSADVLAAGCSDVTVANISATVLLNIWDDLLRITRQPGHLVLTGFPQTEARTLQQLLPDGESFEMDGWCCLAGGIT
jgi:ribosomal protein L11 methyltransferase